jgi:hypothetical protein
MDAGEVRELAVALGLLRLVPSPELKADAFSSQTLSRFLIAGCGLPAQADCGDPTVLQRHLRNGRRVVAVLAPCDINSREGAEEVHELVDPTLPAGDERMVLVEAGNGVSCISRMAATAFAKTWQTAGNRMIVAARSWSSLSGLDGSFFGGWLDPGGVYHWDIAECDTDAFGNVLCCY